MSYERPEVLGIPFLQRRAYKDKDGKTYFNYLEKHMRANRTNINSAPTIKKYEDKGNIIHEPPPITTSLHRYRRYNSINHSSVPNNFRI